MNSSSPLISVIVPAYNAEAFISQTLDSILSQTYKKIEVLVVNDGSQDKTAEIVESIAQKDCRVTLLQQSNAGVAAARNLAIQKSNGEYIAPIDADDIWFPQKLEKQMQLMLKADLCVGLVYAWSAYINEEGLIIGTYIADDLEGDVYKALVYRNFIGNASAPLIRRSCFEQVGDYNCKLKDNDAQGCEDWDLYLRIAESYQFRVVPEFLLGYRQVTGSMSESFTTMERSYNLMLADIQQRHPEIPLAIYQWSRSCFYSYLLGKSFSSANHWSTLVLLYKALRVDFMLLLHPRIYLVSIVCFLMIVFKPVTSLIWPDHRSLLQFRQQLKQKFKSNKGVITISYIERQMSETQRPLFKPYDRVLLQRWYTVVQSCQIVYPQGIRAKTH